MAATADGLAQQFAQRLRVLNSTQQCIESTANWCLFYSREAPTLVRVWDDEFARMPTSDKKVKSLTPPRPFPAAFSTP
jgi:acyl-ACP thioesterase